MILRPQLASTEIYHPANPKPAPMLYSEPGSGQGEILHAGTADLASPSNPAALGEIVELYGSGLLDGSVVPPRVSIGGRAAAVSWFGNASGHPGLNQINVRLPAGIAPGPRVPVFLAYLDRPSNLVTIGVGQP
jgi:uncharacterized protein (TIGR03437 family)